MHSAEKVQGVSHLEGENIHLSYQNSLTKGLPFDASALDVSEPVQKIAMGQPWKAFFIGVGIIAECLFRVRPRENVYFVS